MADFVSRWLSRFGLSPAHWRAEIEGKFATLPFLELGYAHVLLEFLVEELSPILAKKPDPEMELLAEGFAWCCYAFWQCESAFPAFPENYAGYFKEALISRKSDPAAVLLAKMIVQFNAGDGRCGFNRLELAEPSVITESEALVHEGRYEFYLRAREKYDEYLFYLANSDEFRYEWSLIKQTFPAHVEGSRVINRSLMPERNWVRGPGAQFETEAQRFQAIFDLFCWKYYLWGMEGGAPLLLKTSVVFTPYGTQLFIPGYLSLDPKRDLDFSKVMRLHRARGISRQGPGFSIGRRELAELKHKAKGADAEAKKKGLKGDKRYDFICKQVNFRDGGDYRRLRKLLQ